MKRKSLVIAGSILLVFLLFGLLRHSQEVLPPAPETSETESIDKESYNQGYETGYHAAKEENEAVYQLGYETARQEIGRGAFTRYGILGFLTGFMVSSGGIIALKRREFSLYFHKLRKQYELKKAFKTIPSGLSPEVDAIAHHIAQAYSNIQHQLRTGRGHLVEQYARQWRIKLREIMKKAVHLLELIQELELARANIDHKELTRTMRSLKRTIQHPNNSDEARNAAVKSLQRAKQTQHDLVKTERNLEHCTTSLHGVVGLLESMYLKISNLKVNTQQTDQLEELSSTLETEMCALEEVLSDFRER